jgi:hypothetical protein
MVGDAVRLRFGDEYCAAVIVRGTRQCREYALDERGC